MRQVLYALMLAAIVAMPTAVMMLYYQITGDESSRPLSNAVSSLMDGSVAYGEVPVHVQIRLHDPEPEALRRMALSFRKSFAARGVTASVYFVEAGPTEPASVLYGVGRNRIGPFGLSRAAEGISAAVLAYHTLND